MIPLPKPLLACLALCLLGLAGAQAEEFSGRLTFVTGTPVMTANALNQTTVYFTPYKGHTLAVWDTTTSDFEPTSFTELSQLLTDTTHSPAAAAASKNYDLFVWNNGGTLILSRGPAWTSDTVRSSALALVDGIYVNNVAITNGPAAQQGTYVGTIMTNTSAKCDFNLGSIAAGGGAGTIGLWNYYNRRPYTAVVSNSDTTWIYAVSSWRAADNSATNRVTYVTGFNEDTTSSYYFCFVGGGFSGSLGWGVDLDSTTAFPPSYAYGVEASIPGSRVLQTSLGKHYLQAVEYGDAVATEFFSSNDGLGTYAQLVVQGWF